MAQQDLSCDEEAELETGYRAPMQVRGGRRLLAVAATRLRRKFVKQRLIDVGGALNLRSLDFQLATTGCRSNRTNRLS